MANKYIVFLTVILGILFIVIGVIYFIQPAKSLPHFFPGYDTSIIKQHYKHGIGSILLGCACFIFAWFKTGKKISEVEKLQKE